MNVATVNRISSSQPSVDESVVTTSTPNEAQVMFVLTELKKVVAEAKRLYAMKDELESALFGELGMKPGDVVTLESGDVVQFVDNFDGKNIHWGHAAVRRFETKWK